MGSLFKTPKMQTVQAPVAQEVETESEEVAKKKRRADAREYTPPFNPNECAKIQLPPMPEPFDPKWVKQDAMTLLYAKRYDSDDEKPY